MMEQINTFLSKKPDRRTLIIVMVTLVLSCLCCLCLVLALWRPQPAQPTPTSTPTATPTPTSTPTLTPTATLTFTPSVTGSLTPTNTLIPSFTPSLTPSNTATRVPSFTPTPSITPTPNPLSGSEHLSVFMRTGSVWVTSRSNNRLVELDGGDLHVLTILDIDSPNGIAIWQDKGLAYITNKNAGTVSEVDLVAHKITRTIPVGKEPLGVTVIQSTGAVFVANNASNDVSCIPPGVDQAILATGRAVELNGPTAITGFAYSTEVPNTYVVVDSHGQVGWGGMSNASSFKAVAGPACVLSLVTTIGTDGLADVVETTGHPQWFFISDKTGKKIVLLPYAQDLTNLTSFNMPSEPGAITDLGRCVAVVVPAQNRLYLLDTELTKAYKQIKVGKQGDNGGQGLAYNSQTDTAYVANAGDNTVTRIANPCN